MPDQIVLVILEDSLNRIALQLRDDLPEVAYRDYWGLFGGHVEHGESPADAIHRELDEELEISIERSKLESAEIFVIEERSYYVFRYTLDSELKRAKLTEGQHFGLFARSEIEKSEIDGKRIVPHHLSALKRYWENIT